MALCRHCYMSIKAKEDTKILKLGKRERERERHSFVLVLIKKTVKKKWSSLKIPYRSWPGQAKSRSEAGSLTILGCLRGKSHRDGAQLDSRKPRVSSAKTSSWLVLQEKQKWEGPLLSLRDTLNIQNINFGIPVPTRWKHTDVELWLIGLAESYSEPSEGVIPSLKAPHKLKRIQQPTQKTSQMDCNPQTP